MTAFVLVSLLECGCHGQVKEELFLRVLFQVQLLFIHVLSRLFTFTQNKSQRIQNAVAFMETELNSIEKVNVLALTTYALALAGSSMSSKANAKLLEKQVYNRSKYLLRDAVTSSQDVVYSPL